MIDYLILVPHEDDELAIAGPLIYAAANTNQSLKIVFSTNGDYFRHEGAIRIREALAVAKLLGVAEDDVIFLGYGDQVAETAGRHMYNSPAELVVPSANGGVETYGTPDKPEWCMTQHGEHHTYTRGNLKGDIREVIQQFLPRVIVTTGWDNHMDHLALSLLVDEIVADMMREGVMATGPESSIWYQPLVLKGLAYNGKWEGPGDYYRGSNWTMNVNQAIGTKQCYPLHRWEDRIRLAVPEACLTSRIWKSILYQAARIYKSQSVDFKAIQFINRDLVFWRKQAESLTYRAELTVSSGEGEFLCDGKCGDCPDITGDHWNLTQGIWKPDAEDANPRITIRLENPANVTQVWLYESAASFGHLKQCRVNGTIFQTEGARAGGAVVVHLQESTNPIEEVTVELLDWEGDDFGLTELEVYDQITPLEEFHLALPIFGGDDAGQRREHTTAVSLAGRVDEVVLRFREFGRNRLWPYKYFLMKKNPTLQESDSIWRFWQEHCRFFWKKMTEKLKRGIGTKE